MSRNRHTVMGPSLATSYAPDAEGGAADLRVDQLGTSYAPDAEGGSADLRVDQLGKLIDPRLRDVNPLNAESNRDIQLGISAYDLQGATGGQGAAGFAEGSAEGSSVQQLGQPGVLVSDGRMGGLREDDSNLRIGDLRAEDANLRMMGLREDDSNLHLGARGGRRTQQDIRLRGLREDDANLRLSGLREDDANLRLSGLREDDANLRLKGLREDDARIVMGVMRGLREDDSNLKLGSIRTSMILRGMTDAPSMASDLGRKMNRFRPGRPGHGFVGHKKKHAMHGLGAEDFHPRFPVKLEIEGLGVIRTSMNGVQMEGLFDFLKSGPSSEEYMGKLKLIADQWIALSPRFANLPLPTQNAISQNADKAQASISDYQVTVPLYFQDGFAGYQANPGRWARVQRWETYLPTLSKLIAEAEVAGGLSPLQANAVALQNVTDRAAAAGSTSMLPTIGIGLLAGGALTAVILTLV